MGMHPLSSLASPPVQAVCLQDAASLSKELSPAERAKLAKLLGLLGSESPGVRDAAGLAAHRMISTAGMSWSEILYGPPPPPKPVGWRETVDMCLREADRLTDWEFDFLSSLNRWDQLSPKQQMCLDKIAARVGGGQ